jgi:CBS domain containing-hemolysin-like protein
MPGRKVAGHFFAEYSELMAFDIILTLVLVLFNGFFVAAEFAIVKVRASQLELEASKGNKMAQLAKNMVNNLDGYLAATQLGVTLASLGLGWIGEPVVSKLIINLMDIVGIKVSPEMAHSIALPVAFAIITILHIVFGELAPKSIAIQRSEKTTLAISYPLRFFYVIFRPFIWVLNGIANLILKALGIQNTHNAEVHTPDELRYLVNQGSETGTLEKSNSDLIINAFDFGERTVKEIMVSRSGISAVDIALPSEEIIDKMIAEGYSRTPVYENRFDNIIGIIYLKDVLLRLRRNEVIDIRALCKKVLYTVENRQIGKLLREFQQKRIQMAVVIDEYGNVSGLVTMEDVLEELVGEIQDEYDNENPVVKKNSNGNFTVLATASIVDINKYLPRKFKRSSNYQTLSGLLLYDLNRIPDMDEKFTINDYQITVKAIENNSVALVELVDMVEDEPASV